MKSTLVPIVDQGRGPQIAGHRLTVLDVFYYLLRGHDFDFIQRALPSLSREEFDAVVDYVQEHRDELIEKDQRCDELVRQGIDEHKAKNLYREIDESIPDSDRRQRLSEMTRLVSILTSLIELGEGIGEGGDYDKTRVFDALGKAAWDLKNCIDQKMIASGTTPRDWVPELTQVWPDYPQQNGQPVAD
jgi:uncharacterized protein (DUF433 family)